MSIDVPAVLLPYQCRWLEDDSQVKIWEKSRRIGASWCEAADAVLTAAASNGTDVLYTSYNRDIAQRWIADAADWARHFSIDPVIEETLWPSGAEGNRAIGTYVLRFQSGHKILALSSRPTNLRGHQGVVVIDEAAFVDDLGELLKAAMALLMWGGSVHLLSSHNGDLNPFNELVKESRAGNLPYSIHRTTLDDALADGLYQRICHATSVVWSAEAEATWRSDLIARYPGADEELHVIPSSGAGSYIARASIERCMVPDRPVIRLALEDEFLHLPEAERELRIEHWIRDELASHLDALPRHGKHVLGQDFGRSGDLSDIAVASEGDDLTYHVPFVVELRNVPFEAQRQIVFAIIDRLPHFVRAAFDAGGNGSYLAEVAEQRYYGKAEAIKFSEPWYIQHMPKLKDAIENQRLTLPRHADILRDLRAIELIRGVPKVDPNKRQKGSDGMPRHADAAIALALLWYAASEGGEEAAGGLQQPTRDRGRNPNASERARRRDPWRSPFS